jgi:hypothetical protein
MIAKLKHKSLGTITWDGDTIYVTNDALNAQANLQKLMTEGLGDGIYQPTPLGDLYAAVEWLGLSDGITDSSITDFKQAPEGTVQ